MHRRIYFATTALAGWLVACPVLVPLALAQQSTPAASWRYFAQPPRAPEHAPNVLLIMTDDVGFAASQAFGGPIPTLTFDKLAEQGLRYNQFHVTAMCSPTRAALLTGRNHHSVASGVINDVATDEPGYTTVIPESAATIGDVLKANGYATAWFGKNHNTPKWENTPVGPYDRWPDGMGFDYFYGFNAAMTDQFAPALIENRNQIIAPRSSDYILDKDLADHAISWLRIQRNVAPDKPFFMYYATGTPHSPQQAPKAWIDRFKGKFDQGWDKLREETFARQKSLGVIPRDAVLTPRPKEIPAWLSLGVDERRVAARLMEVYAATLAYSDDQIGRVISELERAGEIDNTLVIYVQGDNGASEEGFRGTSNDLAAIGGIEGDTEYMLSILDELGGPRTFGNYPSGWGWAMNTPFQWGKQVASHLGGIRNGLAISWPERLSKTKGQVRTQFHHVIDIAPTIYEAASVKPPSVLGGATQQPIEGVSMIYTFDQAGAPTTHTSQYFEMLGNRSFYKDGWIASTTPQRMPWSHAAQANQAASYKWELYDLNQDYSQSKNVAAKRPDKLKELQAGFDAAASAYNVLPLNSDFIGRLDRRLRPSQTAGRSDFTFYPGPTRYSDGAFPVVGPQWKIGAHIDAPGAGGDGALMVRGGYFVGWGLFVIDNRPVFIFRASDRPEDTTRIASNKPLSAGSHLIEVEYAQSPGAPLPSAGVVLKVDGAVVARGTIPRVGYTGGDVYVGQMGGAPLLFDLPTPFAYPGKIERVDFSIVVDSH
ncbi:MAG: arylsulfatase [Hyphomonadaceae bacterium]|nr:arylsulfatase [Hyphomonadaceae bacterium]